MNEIEWLKYASEHKSELQYLIKYYHPASKVRGPKLIQRRLLWTEFKDNPEALFDFALEIKSWKEINKLLNETWFGVPESTDCWTITGFKEAVHLMEDIPEIEDENECNES